MRAAAAISPTPPPPPPPPTPSTRVRLLITTTAALANLLVFSLVSILGPFYPPYAAAPPLSASPFTTGLVFAFYPLAQIATVPLAGKTGQL